jgi:hypothetical protein
VVGPGGKGRSPGARPASRAPGGAAGWSGRGRTARDMAAVRAYRAVMGGEGSCQHEAILLPLRSPLAPCRSARRGPIGRSPSARAERRALGLAVIHLAVLWSFAVAQPLLDLLGKTPEFFVARGNGRADILVLAFGIVLVPPLVLGVVEALASLISGRLRVRCTSRSSGVLAGRSFCSCSRRARMRRTRPPRMAALAGGLAALLYRRAPAASTVLTVLAPAPLLFVALFLALLACRAARLRQHGGRGLRRARAVAARRSSCWSSTSSRDRVARARRPGRLSSVSPLRLACVALGLVPQRQLRWRTTPPRRCRRCSLPPGLSRARHRSSPPSEETLHPPWRAATRST